MSGHTYRPGDLVDHIHSVPGRWPYEVRDARPCTRHGTHQELVLLDPSGDRVVLCSTAVQPAAGLRELADQLIGGGEPIPVEVLMQLSPWSAVVVARVCERAGVDLAKGELDQLFAEAWRVGPAGRLEQWW